MIIIVIGVSGVGKSTVGALLAQKLGWRFIEGDDFHDEKNWAKLEHGIALNDDDRAPWLARLRDALQHSLDSGESAVLACSALKQSYREALIPPNAAAGDVRFVWLDADPNVVARRLAERTGHRSSARLLESQFETLESAPEALHVDASDQPARIVALVIDRWQLDPKP